MHKRNSLLATIASLAITTSLSGCASLMGGTRFSAEPPPKDNEALVYVLRPFSMDSTLLSASVYWDDKFLVSLGLNDYTVIRGTPGKHKISIDPPFGQQKGSYPEPLEVELASGRAYSLTLRLVQDGITPTKLTMTPIIVGKTFIPMYAQTGGPRRVHKWFLADAANFEQEFNSERWPVLRRAEKTED